MNQTIATLRGRVNLKKDKREWISIEECFNHPSDIFLSGLKIGLIIKRLKLILLHGN